MSGCFTGRPRAGAWSPTTFIMKSRSILASAAGSSGGKSTTRITVPLSGGDRPIGLAALSSLNENPGGKESVIHRLAAGFPDFPGLSVRRLSNSAIALLFASMPVTTRRTSAALPVEQASIRVTMEQNILRIMAFSLFPGASDVAALLQPLLHSSDDRSSAQETDNIRRSRQEPVAVARGMDIQAPAFRGNERGNAGGLTLPKCAIHGSGTARWKPCASCSRRTASFYLAISSTWPSSRAARDGAHAVGQVHGERCT